MANVETSNSRKLKRLFKSADGEISSRAPLGCVAVILETSAGDRLEMDLSTLSEDVMMAAAAFGVNTSVGNVAGPLEDPQEIIEAIEARWETLKEGSWSEERATGPRTKDLVEAWARFRAAHGAPSDDAWKETATSMILNKEKSAKELLSMPGLKAEYDAIKAQRAVDRASKSKAAAENTDANVGDLLD